MAGFKGQAEYSVDNKGRVAIPAKMRNALNPEAKNSFVVTHGLENCISAYPHDKWDQVEAEIGALNMFRPEDRAFVRRFLMLADDAPLDGQGRITLPKILMDKVGITDRALILGTFDHLEIWDPETFNKYLNEQSSDYETLAERVMGITNGVSARKQ